MDKERRVWVVRRGVATRRKLSDRRHEDTEPDGVDARQIVRRYEPKRRHDRRRKADSEEES